jgi:hypothetical protein
MIEGESPLLGHEKTDPSSPVGRTLAIRRGGTGGGRRTQGCKVEIVRIVKVRSSVRAAIVEFDSDDV